MNTLTRLSAELSHLRVKHLLLLEMVAEEGSLRRVASRLHVTQPAVSAMVQDLERVFQLPLVQRGRQGAALTAAGQAARERLQRVLNELQAASLASAVNPAARLLTVGTAPVAMLDLVPRIVQALSAQEPELSIRFVEQTVEATLAQLHAGKIDCAITRLDATVLARYPADAFHFETLLSMQLEVVCGRAHPLFDSRPREEEDLSLARLARESWALLSSSSQARAAFDQAFVQSGHIPPLPVVESLSFASALLLVTRTNLLTIAPSPAAREFEGLGLVKRLALQWPVQLSPLMLITRQDGGTLADLRTLSRLLQQLTNGGGADEESSGPA